MENHFKDRKLLIILLLSIAVVAAIAVYVNALPNGFVNDDEDQILGNPWITDIRYLPDTFVENVWAFQGTNSNYYRPMMHLFYMATYSIFGLAPWGFHLVNVLFHAGVTLMVFFLTARILSVDAPSTGKVSLYSSFVAAMLFAVHPIHTEAVSWIAGIPDLSFALFFLLSFYFHIRSESRFDKYYAFSVASFALAVFCKEPALALPFVLVAYDFAFKRSKLDFHGLLKRYSAYFLVALIYILMRFNALEGFAPLNRHPELNLYHFIINVFPLFVQYLQKLVLPIDLNFFHVFQPITSILAPKGLLSLLATVAYGLLTWLSFRRSKVVFIGLVLIALPLLPVLYVPALGLNAFAERYLYLPSAGFVLAVAGTLNRDEVYKGVRAGALAGLFLVVSGLYATGTFLRNPLFESDFTIYNDAARKSPESDVPHEVLGHYLMKNGRLSEAIEEFRFAIRLNPEFAGTRNNLGLAYYGTGAYDQAAEQFSIAAALAPENAGVRNNLGLAMMEKERIGDAIGHFQSAISLRPDFADAYNNLGIAFARSGMIREATEQFQRAVQFNPGDPDYRVNLANARSMIQ